MRRRISGKGLAANLRKRLPKRKGAAGTTHADGTPLTPSERAQYELSLVGLDLPMSDYARKNNPLPSVYALGRWRIAFIWLVLLGFLCFLLGRLLWIQVLYPDRLIAESDNRTIRSYTYEPPRGLIADRNGKLLALSVPVKAVVADAAILNERKINRNPELVEKIARLVEMDATTLFQKISDPTNRYVQLNKYVPLNLARELESLDIPGITISDNYQRYYPTGAVNAHIVGKIDYRGNGAYGVEQSFNQYLSAQSSKKKFKRDSNNHIIENLEVIEQGKEGGNLALSVDDRLQTFSYEALQDAVIQHDAETASAVMLDATTGEILVMVNYPSFDPNDRLHFDPSAARNRAITDTFEPGSTIKPIVALAALETGEVNWTDTFDTRPYIVNGKMIRDSHRMDNTSQLLDIIKYSSNIGMAHIAQRIGPSPIVQMLERFGFGARTNSGFAGEAYGNLHTDRTFWSEIDKATLGFGYGITVTALQMASAYATLANYGARLPVSILRTTKQPSYVQVANINEIRRMHTALETVVEQGSGKKAAINRYRIAGKTGTAHIASAGGYAEDYVASFVGFAPISNPRFVLVVVVYKPKGNYFGSSVAAPVFSDIMTRALQLYNIPPDK